MAGQAGWKCDACRKAGLETKRRCGYLASAQNGTPRVIWARNGVATESCPVSFITAASLAWLDAFFVWRALGRSSIDRLSARDAEAYLLLEHELIAELDYAKRER